MDTQFLLYYLYYYWLCIFIFILKINNYSDIFLLLTILTCFIHSYVYILKLYCFIKKFKKFHKCDCILNYQESDENRKVISVNLKFLSRYRNFEFLYENMTIDISQKLILSSYYSNLVCYLIRTISNLN